MQWGSTVRSPLLPQPAQEQGGGGAPPSPARRVLVVDDNADSAETMEMLLQVGGRQVRTARDGPSAIAAASEQRPDVILLDIGLPGMTGYELAEKLRQTPGAEKALLVAMTGYGQAEDRARSRQAGFAAHLVKPIQPDALARLMAELPAIGSL
ncbi:MAG TPA: response regulator [Vicinamibacteria bacterium]|nr:response regulator [Vicinamibacteria bacterium]